MPEAYRGDGMISVDGVAVNFPTGSFSSYTKLTKSRTAVSLDYPTIRQPLDLHALMAIS